MSDQSDDSIDPNDIYPLEEFMAEQNILSSFGSRIQANIKAKVLQGSTSIGIVKGLMSNLWLITSLKILFTLMQFFVEDSV
jgi:hypothetical protein